MARRMLVVALVAGVTAATVVTAQPVTRPSDSPAEAEKLAARSSSSSRAKRLSKPTPKPKAKAKAKSKTKSKAQAKAKAKAKSKSKTKAKVAAKSRPKSKAKKTRARVAMRTTSRADNMPRGFEWPPSQGMISHNKACEAELDARGVIWRPAAQEPDGRIIDPITVPSMEIGGITYRATYRKPPHTLDCQLVRTLAILAPELRALGVKEVRFGSIYRNTMVRSHGKTRNILSRHALGLAMDVMAFVDESGRVAVVETEYPKGDPLLLGIEEAINRSNLFRILLTPKNDPISHDDHFHIEASVDFTAPPP